MACNETLYSDNFTSNYTNLCPYENGSVKWLFCIFLIFAPQAVQIDRIVTPFWYCIGLIGNILTINVWTNRRLKRLNTSSLYLTVLAVTDTMLLLLHILIDLQYAWGKNTLIYPVWGTIFFVLYYFAQYMSPLLVFGFTCERFISIIRPFKSERFSRHSRAPKEVACLIVFAFIIALGQIMGWNAKDGKLEPLLANVYMYWTYVTESVLFIVIPLLTLVFNILVLRTARQATIVRQESTPSSTLYTTKENQNRKPKILPTTLTLMAVSFYRIFTTAPIAIIYMFQYEVFPSGNHCLPTSAIATDPVWQKYFQWLVFKKTLDEIGMSQYSCNIFIYIVTAKHFRAELKRMLCSKVPCTNNESSKNDFVMLNHSNGMSLSRPTNGSMV